jgi:hypothetical protein
MVRSRINSGRRLGQNRTNPVRPNNRSGTLVIRSVSKMRPIHATSVGAACCVPRRVIRSHQPAKSHVWLNTSVFYPGSRCVIRRNLSDHHSVAGAIGDVAKPNLAIRKQAAIIRDESVGSRMCRSRWQDRVDGVGDCDIVSSRTVRIGGVGAGIQRFQR